MSVRVLIVDDSALARKILSQCLQGDDQIEVVGVASSTDAAWHKMQRLKPDVLMLDLEMKPKDGLSFLCEFMPKQPIPTVVISSLGARSVAALAAGAVFVVAKPSGSKHELTQLQSELRKKVKDAARTAVRSPRTAAMTQSFAAIPATARRSQARRHEPALIAIGTSTGGTTALSQILPRFPADSPPIVIVDHMPAGFTKDFADRLSTNCAVQVVQAEDGAILKRGEVHIAPGGEKHMTVVRLAGVLRIQMVDGPLAGGHRPAINVLLNSVAKVVGSTAAGAILTGMGRDGAQGLLAMRRAGGSTYAQNESSSVVFGMPKAAIELGAACETVSLSTVPRWLLGRE